MREEDPHAHKFDGEEIRYEKPYLGGSIMAVYTARACSICGILEIDSMVDQEEDCTVA